MGKLEKKSFHTGAIWYSRGKTRESQASTLKKNYLFQYGRHLIRLRQKLSTRYVNYEQNKLSKTSIENADACMLHHDDWKMEVVSYGCVIYPLVMQYLLLHLLTIFDEVNYMHQSKPRGAQSFHIEASLYSPEARAVHHMHQLWTTEAILSHRHRGYLILLREKL